MLIEVAILPAGLRVSVLAVVRGPETWLPSDWPDSVFNCVTRHYFPPHWDESHPATNILTSHQPPGGQSGVPGRAGYQELFFLIKKNISFSLYLTDSCVTEL